MCFLFSSSGEGWRRSLASYERQKCRLRDQGGQGKRPRGRTPGRARPRPPRRLRSWAAILSPLRSRPRSAPRPRRCCPGSAAGTRGPCAPRNQREGSGRAAGRELRRNLPRGTHRHVLVRRSSPPERSESGNPGPYIRRPAGSDAWASGRHVGKVLRSRPVRREARRGRHFRKVCQQ